MCELPNGDVDFEPEKYALDVEVSASSIRGPFCWREIKYLGGERRVL